MFDDVLLTLKHKPILFIMLANKIKASPTNNLKITVSRSSSMLLPCDELEYKNSVVGGQ